MPSTYRIIFICLFLPWLAYSQTYTIEGTGTSGTLPRYSPYTNNYDNSRNQFIITAAELRNLGSPWGGIISAIQFRGNANGGSCTVTFNIQLKHTTLNEFPNSTLTTATGWDSGFTSFYSGSFNSNNVSGWKSYPGSFCWNGISNIIVEICKKNSCANPSAPSVYYHMSNGNPCGNTQRYGYGDGGTNSNCTWFPSTPLYYGHTTYRPDIRFTITPTVPCPVNTTVITSTASLCQILPVELVKFSGYPVNNKVQLDWVTASEINSDYYTIERSADGILFEEIKTIKGSGNSTSILNYTVIDDEPLAGVNYYRLIQTDFDGKYKESSIIYVDRNLQQIKMSALYPNPTNNTTDFDFYTPIQGKLHFTVIDYMGKIVLDKTQQINEGSTTLTAHTEELPSGIYSLIVRFNETDFTTISKIVKY